MSKKRKKGEYPTLDKLAKKDATFVKEAKRALDETWFSADSFIPLYVVGFVDRQLADGYGVPSHFLHDYWLAPDITGAVTDLGVRCHKLSLKVLRHLAVEAAADMDGLHVKRFYKALAEAVSIGMLWD